jgi:hypothetical protein
VDPRQRGQVAAFLGVLTGGLALVTLIWRDWIEAVFHVDPDHGNGSVEWLVVMTLAIVSVACFVIARRGFRQIVTTTR